MRLKYVYILIMKKFDNKQKIDSQSLSYKRTLLAAERTLLSQIRTASIFIGITYIVFYKLDKKKKIFHYLISIIIFIILITNIYSIILFYKKTDSQINKMNIVPIIYGSLLSILVSISLFYFVYFSIKGI